MPSTVIAKIAYDEAKRTLRIIYRSGSIYDYKKVPPEQYVAMKAAFSKGTFLNQYIKGHYDYVRIK